MALFHESYKKMKHPLITIRDLLRYAVSHFNDAELVFGQGNDNAYDEAVYLILHTLKLPIDTLDPFLDAKLLDTEIAKIINVIDTRVIKRMPAAYITQEAWLQGYRFYIDERAIVPRSFIAELLVQQLSPWITHADRVENILELCTGSGCLSIIAADIFPNAAIDAIDISEEALQIAQKNIDDYQLNDRIHLHQGNLYAPLSKSNETGVTFKYDLIMANPPYVNTESMNQLPAEFQKEPAIALAGGEDGMDCVRQIIDHARPFLKDEGVLIIEIGHERAHVESAFGGIDLVWLTTSIGDDSVFLIRAADLPD